MELELKPNSLLVFHDNETCEQRVTLKVGKLGNIVSAGMISKKNGVVTYVRVYTLYQDHQYSSDNAGWYKYDGPSVYVIFSHCKVHKRLEGSLVFTGGNVRSIINNIHQTNDDYMSCNQSNNQHPPYYHPKPKNIPSEGCSIL